MKEYLNLPNGENQKRMADAMERLADGKPPITDYSNAPGNKALMAGDNENGFYGFVQPHEFGVIQDNLESNQDFNGKNLALAIGLSSGTSQHENTSWMKFSRNGEIYFVPVKPIRHTLSWNSIYNQGAVYGDDTMGVNPPNGRAGNTISVSETDNSFRIDEIEDHWQRDGTVIATVGDTIVAKGFTEDENNGEFEVTAITDYKITVNKTLVAEARSDKVSVYKKTDGVKQDREVTIGDNKYKVQLLKSAASDPLDSYADGDRGLVGEASEWNSLILPMHERAKLQDWNYKSYAGTTEDWGIGLNDLDLITHHTLGNGNYTWCQETGDTYPARRMGRGSYAASDGGVGNSWYAHWARGWRPVLRLIN